MIKADDPENEKQRLNALESYSILDSLPEQDYDNLTAIASEICGTPIALVTLLDKDRQWFKSHHGLEVTETPREYAFCAHAIVKPDEVLIVKDSRKDKRFINNPLVKGAPHVIFYAGVPLLTKEGLPLGTLCVIDNSPKSLSKNQINSLKALSKQVMNLIELRKHKTIIEKTLEEVQRRNRELEDFAYIAAHDIKSPLNNISNLADLLKNDYEGVLDNEGKRILNLIKNSSTKLKSLVSGLLKHSQSENLKKEDKEHFSLKQFIDEVWGLFNVDQAISLNFHSTVKEIEVNKTALEQILINLISNAIKYNDKENIEIEIGVNDNVNEYEFYVKDNGPGIDPIYHKQIFNIFEVLTNKDRFQEPGNGIGLATVKKIVHQLDGRIEVKSKINEGAKFIFYLKK